MIKYEYKDGILKSQAKLEDSYYMMAGDIYIAEIVFYGIERPVRVTDVHKSKLLRLNSNENISYDYNY